MQDTLTTQAYWESYYKHSKPKQAHIIKVCSVYDQYWKQFMGNETKDKTLIEIGGYPGRYLAYLSHKFDVVPTCLDFNSDKSVLEESFRAFKLENYNIIQADFTKFESEMQYDYVMSNGFIEHFEDYNTILDKHVKLLKPGGKLFVMIPNKRYLRKYYGYLCDYKNLKAHNLKCMSKSVFEKFGNRNNLKKIEITYYGGFPFNVHQKLNRFQKLIFKSFRQVFKFYINPYLEKKPSKYLSANLIAIFEKAESFDAK